VTASILRPPLCFDPIAPLLCGNNRQNKSSCKIWAVLYYFDWNKTLNLNLLIPSGLFLTHTQKFENTTDIFYYSLMWSYVFNMRQIDWHRCAIFLRTKKKCDKSEMDESRCHTAPFRPASGAGNKFHGTGQWGCDFFVAPSISVINIQNLFLTSIL
jgi:hypothetical protein